MRLGKSIPAFCFCSNNSLTQWLGVRLVDYAKITPAQFIRFFSTNEPLLIGGSDLGRCLIFRRPLKQSAGLFNYHAIVSSHPNQLCGGGMTKSKLTSVPLPCSHLQNVVISED
ncbi:Uncharacterised protein [Streptococcus criceti]|nr:Uncharacterised protein [Streptococcus criceti]